MKRINGDDLFYPVLDRQNLNGGVSIRAEFAKAAMQGILSNPGVGHKFSTQIVAEDSVQYADALIEELNKGE